MGGLGLLLRTRAIKPFPTEGSAYILSETRGDAEVFRILMANGVSSDGVGITKEDAEKVTNIASWFNGNTIIEKFNEFQFFTKITILRDNAFRNCGSLKSIVLPESITQMYAYAFNTCSSLLEINIPKSLASIGAGCFSGVPAPMVIDMPNYASFLPRGAFSYSGVVAVRNIGNCTALYDEAFRNCKSLRYAIIPSSIQTLQANVFNGCDALEYIIFQAAEPPTIGANNFPGNNCPVYVPDASVDAYKAADKWGAIASRIKPLSEFQG